MTFTQSPSVSNNPKIPTNYLIFAESVEVSRESVEVGRESVEVSRESIVLLIISIKFLLIDNQYQPERRRREGQQRTPHDPMLACL